MKETLLAPLQTEERFWNDPSRGGMRVRLGTYPCTFNPDAPHPVASIAGRRVARFRRNLEGGMRYHAKLGESLYYVVMAMQYDKNTGKLATNLRYATQRFIQKIERGEHHACEHRACRKSGCRKRRVCRESVKVAQICVKEPNGSGIENHTNLVIATKGDLPSKHELKGVWAASTYGTSYELEVKKLDSDEDVGKLSRYLSKFLGSYLSKTLDGPSPDGQSFPEGSGATGGLDSATKLQRVSSYVSMSRDWLPVGAGKEWLRLFRENAWFWTCDRGFVHTNMGATAPKWLNWLDRQAWGST